jgi:polyphosphate kinase
VQTILGAVDYAGKDKGAIGKPDKAICGGPKLRPKD